MIVDSMRKFWRGRRVLLTGHTGFKGSWMSVWMRRLGAEVTGLALPPQSQPSLWSLIGGDFASINGDIRNADTVSRAVRSSRPQVVIHMAAQALVRASYQDPCGTYATNVVGTANVLDACRSSSTVDCVLVVTSDKVYENEGQGRLFVESDRLGGHDPYSSSKACTELVSQSFRDCFFGDGRRLATARAGNVIGGGDWSADRLVPDCVRALAVGTPILLRNPGSIRPWQHVLEPLSGYLMYVQALLETTDAPAALNFGPDLKSCCTVREIVDRLSARFGGRPGWVSDGGRHPKEASVLMLDSQLARSCTGWKPRLDLDAMLAWTADWYLAHSDAADMLKYTLDQVANYEQRMISS
jgi:CDP-glucose 4,6-dehydratase